MTDTLAPRGIIGVMTPAMNTVVQPELELLRPAGVTNQMQRFRLGGDMISDDLPDEAEKLMDCHPLALAIGLTTDAGPGGVAKLAANAPNWKQVSAFRSPTHRADHAALRFGAKRVCPDRSERQGEHRRGRVRGCRHQGNRGAVGLPAICETSIADIKSVFATVAGSDCDAILQVARSSS